jgi:hypothetical protein
MQSLKATKAREIDKSAITEAETLAFEGRIISQTGKQTMEPGEFYFRSTGIPIAIQPRWLAQLFGAKPKTIRKTMDRMRDETEDAGRSNPDIDFRVVTCLSRVFPRLPIFVRGKS